MKGYAPRFTETIQGQFDGWPTFVDDEGKRWATEKAREYFGIGQMGKAFRPLGHCFLPTTYDFADWLLDRNRHGDIPDCLRVVALHDARAAVAHRALLAAGMHQVWLPERANHLVDTTPI